MEERSMEHFQATTSLLIAPGYSYRLVKGIVTNFHLPKSTLLLLISALIGDGWKEMYQEALAKQYKFLSYGDSSLLIP
jgi:S-adenosylmethionine:tRNA ribosyltransferase-isomerase